MLSSPWIAAVSAVFLWWFSTGAILWVVKRADEDGSHGHVWASLLSLPVLLAGVVGLQMSLGQPDAAGAYIAFLSALAIWGWIELSFLSGLVTGPNRDPCPANADGWKRFWSAVTVIAYHEALLFFAVLAIWGLSHGAENQFAFWTFAVLFFARISAKLNLFLGVPRINTEFLPKPLRHIPSYFRIRKINWMFPISITVLSFATACWLERLMMTGEIGFALLAALTALATLEHWLMILPLPDAKLWRWMLPTPKEDQVRNPHGL